MIAYNTDVVRSQIQGQLVRITFKEGQTVKAGDLLAEIDPRPYQAQIEQLTANRARDQAQLTNAEANLSRYTQLGDKGYATPQLVDTQKAQVAQLQAAVQADQAADRPGQGPAQLYAADLAIPGITGIRQIDVGNIIHPTDPNGLVVVTQIEPISLLFTLPADRPAAIQSRWRKGHAEGASPTARTTTCSWTRATLLLVNNEIAGPRAPSSSRRNFPIKSIGCGRDSWSMPACCSRRGRTAITVAGSAVQQGQNGTYVYVVKPDQTADAAARSRRADQRRAGADRSGARRQARSSWSTASTGCNRGSRVTATARQGRARKPSCKARVQDAIP